MYIFETSLKVYFLALFLVSENYRKVVLGLFQWKVIILDQ